MIIYKITNSINNKAYVGQCQTSLNERWRHHKTDAYRFDGYFQRAIRKYDTECWKFEILEEVEDINLLNEAEMKWIEYYDTFNRDKGYNSTNGGVNGFIVSEETKEKMRQARLGKKASEETKEKIGQAKLGNKIWLGKCHSEESKEKIGQAKLGNKIWLGKHHTEETKEKMRLAKLGKTSNRLGKKLSEESKEKL